jgi:hypothetical protein
MHRWLSTLNEFKEIKGSDMEFLKIHGFPFTKKPDSDKYLIDNCNFTYFLNFSR